MTEQLSPQAELNGYREQRIAGTLSHNAYFAHAERLGPLIEGGTTPTAPSASSQALARIDQLKADRLSGKLSQDAYLAQMDQLGPQAHPGGQDAEVSAELDRAFTPPSSPAEYRFEYDSNFARTPEAQAWDNAMRTAFHGAGVPQSMASVINTSANQLQERLKGADEATINAHVADVGSQLRKLWGNDYDAKIARIDAMLDQVKGPLGAVLDEAPWVLADPIVFSHLDALAEHRARKRA